jgi:hypothetical protein
MGCLRCSNIGDARLSHAQSGNLESRPSIGAILEETMKNIRTISIAVALFAIPFLPACAQSAAFTKNVATVNGATVSAQPTSLTNGDVVGFVMTYQWPATGQPAQTNIQDMLPPTLQYVPNSLQAPPSWTRQWYNTSWVTSEPPSPTGVGAVIGFPNMTPFGNGQAVAIPAPPSGTFNTTGASGDGYRAIPYNGNVYVINHHSDSGSGTYLDCYVVATGNRCSGYPYHVPNANNAPFDASSDNFTPGKTYEFIDRTNGRMYFSVEKKNSSFPDDLGILCADLINKKSCGFTSLMSYTPTGTPKSYFFQGIGGVGTKVYMQLPTGKIGCLDISSAVPAQCAGSPYQVGSAASINSWGVSSEIVGNRIFTLWNGSPFTLTCFDTTTAGQCLNWGAGKTPDPAGVAGIINLTLDGSTGNPKGVCVHTTNPANNSFKCYDISLATLINPTPPNYATWVTSYGGGGFAQAGGFGQPAYYDKRAFNGSTNPSGRIGCFDFQTDSNCQPPFPANGVPNATLKHYATIADPERPGCMWYDGDDGKIGAFSAFDGGPCGAHTLVETVVTPALSYCAGGRVTAWDKLSLYGLTLGGGVTVTLSIYDATTGLLAVDASGVAYANNVTLNSLPFNLGMGYGTGPGNYKSLKFVLQFNGITSSAPWTNTPPPHIEVSWAGDPPEFCFKATVATCEGPVTNQATATTVTASGQTSTATAPNPPFSATHIPGKDCLDKLTVMKSVIGAPGTFTGTFKFNVTCSTPNGLLQQQLSINWPSTSVTLTGIPAGSTCTISEDPVLPPLPTGYSWSGLPISSPASGVVVITAGGANTIFFRNTARPCEDLGRLKITKLITGAPAGFTGTFTFNVACWNGTSLITQQAQVTIPGQPSITLNGIPIGSTCTVTEINPLPTLPAGWFWQPPTYSPASGQVALIGNCCPEVVVTNHPKYCCKEWDGPVPWNPNDKN